MLTDHSRPVDGDYPCPEIIRGNIQRVSVRGFDNMITCDVLDVKGNLYTAVQTIAPTSGNDSSYVKPSLKLGAEVLLLKLTNNSQPYIIGSTFSTKKLLVSNTAIVPPVDQDDNAICTSDYVVENSGNRLSLNSFGRGIVLSANKDVRIQLANEGVLRISHVGETEDYVLNGFAFIKSIYPYIKQLHDKEQKLEELQDSLIETITAIVNALSVWTATDGPVLSSLGLAGAATLATTLGQITTTNIAGLNTTNTELDTLPLDDHDDARVSAINTLNSKVLIPAGG